MIVEAVEFVVTSHQQRPERAARPQEEVAAWIDRARKGDLAAFDCLVGLYQPRVMALAWRMLGNTEDAKDATQDVFVRLYRHLRRYDPEREFTGWLYRITINVCHDKARARRKHDRLIPLDAAAGETRPEFRSRENVEAEVLRAEEIRWVRHALDTLLTEKERAALVLRDLEGMPTGEVARILGSSKTTVRSQISSARTKMKQHRDRIFRNRGRGTRP